jgi:hypothetical protein
VATPHRSSFGEADSEIINKFGPASVAEVYHA